VRRGREAVADVERVLARGQARLAADHERGAVVGPDRVDAALVVGAEVLAAAARGEAQGDGAVLALEVRAAEEILAARLAPAVEVGLVEDHVGVVAAGRALEAVEVDLPRRALVDAVAIAPVED